MKPAMTSISPVLSNKNNMNQLQEHLLTIEKQLAEQTLLRQKLEELTNIDSTRSNNSSEKPNSGQQAQKKEVNRIFGSAQKEHKPTSNKDLEQVLAKRKNEFQQSQAAKATNIQFLVQQRQQIIEARSRLKEKKDMFYLLPSSAGGEVIMKTPSKHTRVRSPQTSLYNVINHLPDALDRIWTLRDDLYHDYLSKRKPYAGELGIESYEPWQIPDFLMVRRLVEGFIDDFLIKHVPSDLVILEREIKMKRLNQKDKDWGITSKALLEKSVVKLVAEEILLEVTASMTRDVANEDMQLDAMFRHMSGNMFIKLVEIQATGNPKGRDPNDPVYDLVTHSFNSMQRSRDQQKKHLWVHSQMFVHPAIPPPMSLIHEPVSEPVKVPRQKTKKLADKKMDNKTDDLPHKRNF